MKAKRGNSVIPKLNAQDGYIIFYARADVSNEQALTTDINREYMATYVRRKAVENKAATSKL